MSLSLTTKRGLAALAAACLASVALPAVPAMAQKVKNKTPVAEAPAVNYSVDIPSIDAVDSSIDDAAIADILSGNVAAHAGALAELDATSITVPQITVTLDIIVDGQKERGTLTFTNLVLEDVVDGIAASVRLEGSSFETPDGTAQIGTTTAANFNLAGVLGVYGLAASPTRDMQTLYTDFLMEGGTFEAEEVSCTFGATSGAEMRGRPLDTSFIEIMQIAQELESTSDNPDPELIGRVMRMYGDILTAFESSEFTFDGLACETSDGDEFVNFSIAGITMGGISPGIYPAFSIDGFNLTADDGSMSFDNFTIKPMDLSGIIDLLSSPPAAMDDAWVEANMRALIPAFEGFSFAGFSMDIPDSANTGERIVADVAEFDLTLANYINGIPSALDTWARGIAIDLPENSGDDQIEQMIALGLTNIDAGFRVAASWQSSTDTIAIEEVSISGVDLATIALTGTLANVPSALFSLDTNEALMASMGVAVKALSVNVTDAGIADLVMAAVAAEQGADPAALRPVFAGLAEGTVLGMLAGAADAAKLGSAINAFVSGTAKSLNISIEAKTDPGLSLEDFMMAEEDPTLLLGKVNIDASAK